ncbi:MAG: hypothetical protein WC989_01490 [Micavibrio sp.]
MANKRKKLTVVDVIVEGFKAAARGEKDLPAWMEHQLRADQAERDINAYRELLGEWEQEFKDRYGKDSQEYKVLAAENEKTKKQLDKDLNDLDNPQTQMKAIEFYRSICAKYRKFEQVEGSHEYKQVKLRREPGII